MGSRKYVDGFAKVPPVSDRPGIPCVVCGIDVNTTGTSLPVVEATCAFDVTQGPVGQRKAERLAKRKSGVRK